MRHVIIPILLSLCLFAVSCSDSVSSRTPLETLQLYHQAVVDKDPTQMKLLLSEATLKLHSDQAKRQNVTLDEIVLRETFFPATRKKFKFKPAKIDGNNATVEVENTFGGWDEVILVNENGGWKIDKKGTAQQIIDQGDIDVQKLEDQIDAERNKINEQLDQQDNAADSPSDDFPTDIPPAGSDGTGDGGGVAPPPPPPTQ